MKDKTYLSKGLKYSLWMVLFVIIEIIIALIIVRNQYNSRINEIQQQTAVELHFLESEVQVRLQRNDYITVDYLIQDWGKAHSDHIIELKLTATNGTILSHYRRKTQSKHTFSLTNKIIYSYHGTAKLFTLGDLSTADAYLRNYLISSGLIILLSILFFIYINREILRRKYFEIALKQSNRELNKMVIDLQKEIKERKRVEEALRESDEKFRSISATAQDAIIMIDNEGNISYWNQAAERIFGYTKEEATGKKVYKLIVPSRYYEVVNRVFDTFKKSGQGPAVGKTLEFRAIRKSGTEFPIELSISPLKVKGQWHAAAIIRDITQRKQAIEALQESERYYRTLLNQLHEDLMVITPDYHIADINNTILVTSNLKREEVLGRYCYEVLHGHKKPCDEEGEVCPLKEIFKTGQSVNTVHEHVREDGSKVWVDILFSPLTDKEGKITHVIESVRDISKLIQTQERLRKLSVAVEQSPVSITITDSQGNIEFVNPKFLEITGYTFEEVKGKNSRILKSGNHSKAFYKELWDTITSGKIWRGQFHNRKKNGELFWEDATIGPIKDENGKITHYVSMKVDITEKKLLEEQLSQAQKLEGIGQLAGGIAHDFNNILTAINGYAEMALMKLDKDNRVYRDIKYVLDSAKKAENLVRQLLAFSRKQVFQPRIIDVNKTIHDLHKLLNRMIGEDIEIKMILTEDIPPIKADPVQFEQILINLFVNARDAINQKTERASEKRITIETAEVILDEQYVSSHVGSSKGSHILISISDNGIGMDKKIMNRIFEPFFTTKGAGKGTGLGLSTVYGIVKQNNGSICVYSEPGVGTTFKIYWPALGSEVPTLEESKDKEEIKGGKETILIVEDDEKVRDIATNILRSFGYKVYEASNGVNALDLVKNGKLKIDLLVTDLIMPKMNGKELVENLKDIFPSLKIIYCSGYADHHISDNFSLEKGISFISKPYSRKNLAKKVREILDND